MIRDDYYAQLETDLAQWHEEKAPWLLSRLFCVFAIQQTDPRTQDAKRNVASVLAKYLQEISIDRIFRTDVQMRQSTSMEWWSDWKGYRIEDFLTGSMSTEERRAVTIFASFHCCGYVRQRAVRALPDYPDSLPFIALRLADSVVTEVRREARQAFARRLPLTTDRELLDTLPVIERVKDRGNLQTYISMLAPRLERNNTLFDSMLSDPSREVRRFGISNIRDFFPETETYGPILIRRLPTEPDPFLRQLILKTLLDSDLDIRPHYAFLFRDKYPPNRKLALTSLYDTDPAAGEAMARILLLDKNAAVRHAARMIVRRHDPTVDFSRFYRNRVEEYPAICLVEIAATGQREDAAKIEKFLFHPQPRICRAAMSAVMRLDAPNYAPRMTEMLASPQSGIAKTAARLLHGYRLYDAERIFEIQQHSSYEHTKLCCLPLLFAAPKYKALIYLLRMLGTGGEETDRSCLRYIKLWLQEENRSYLTIAPSERAELQRLVDEKEVWLTEPEAGWYAREVVDRLRFAVR